ncbi:MAG: anaerobic ribonucleoside-triphosphate reductase activating protein [Treponema sp.]|nr:anaerobic ribonucleoside-triphosphate reductase activating protein [Treponema sp.]
MNVTLQKTSLVDYPKKIAAVIFFIGCNLRCPWCHNHELATGEVKDVLSLDQALAHIRKRRAVLGGVVLSGGEPTLYTGLTDIIATVKAMGLPVKLDTNGVNPAALEAVLQEPPPDYIALDLKFAPDRYDGLLLHPAHEAGLASVGSALKQSAALIHESGVAHEFRTLALPNMDEADVDALAPLVDEAPWLFRVFKAGHCLDPRWNTFADSSVKDVEKLVRRARELGKNAEGGSFGGEGN